MRSAGLPDLGNNVTPQPVDGWEDSARPRGWKLDQLEELCGQTELRCLLNLGVTVSPSLPCCVASASLRP